MPDQRIPLHTLRLLLRLSMSAACPSHFAVAYAHAGTGGRLAMIDKSTWRTQP